MTNTFLLTLSRRMWGSPLPLQLMRAILVAALLEALLYLVSARLRRALAPALARDARADNAQRLERHRIVLGIPLLLARVIAWALALAIILRIFTFRVEADVYPLAVGVLVLWVVGARNVLRDAVAGYFIHYDYLYRVGDEITVGENSGMVSEVGLRHTKLRTRDGQEVVIGNAEVRTLINRTGPKNLP